VGIEPTRTSMTGGAPFAFPSTLKIMIFLGPVSYMLGDMLCLFAPYPEDVLHMISNYILQKKCKKENSFLRK
jgi:hypothetical protein